MQDKTSGIHQEDLNLIRKTSLAYQYFRRKKDYDIVSPYRTGCYDITFLIQDYLANSTVDNKGDKSCYILAITDDIEDSEEDILTAETFDVNNSPLFPRISNLLNGDIINNQVPIVRGYSLPSETINIYVDGALEGSATADSNGNWSFQLINALSTYVQDVSDGVHLIQATYTNLGAPTSDVTLVIDSNNQSETRIVYPSNSQHLYNNKPLLKGVSQSGNSVQIWINSILVSTQVSDNSCKWEYKISTPLPNGVNTINITRWSKSAIP
ncbi:MAG: hypothetical protein IPI98_02680 [Chitinophagaceae bacterium]|nr:hypothetical protein [Chitinophagaceae bacterium]